MANTNSNEIPSIEVPQPNFTKDSVSSFPKADLESHAKRLNVKLNRRSGNGAYRISGRSAPQHHTKVWDALNKERTTSLITAASGGWADLDLNLVSREGLVEFCNDENRVDITGLPTTGLASLPDKPVLISAILAKFPLPNTANHPVHEEWLKRCTLTYRWLATVSFSLLVHTENDCDMPRRLV